MENEKSQVEKLIAGQKRTKRLFLLLLALTFAMALISLFVGQYGMTFSETVMCILGVTTGEEAENILRILWNIRVPRTLASLVIGGSLAIAGLTYQGVFRNNLVSQDILGVSTSACVGAAIGIIAGLSAVQIQVVSFAMGMLNVGLIFLLSSRIKLEKTLSLILSGILIGGAMSSVLALIKYTASPEKHLRDIVFWTMGDISSISLKQLGFIAVPIAVALGVLLTKRWQLNYFSFNDAEAKSIGFDIAKNRTIFLICATILVASAVSISGSIGWVGLVIPQLVRLLIGANSKNTIPLAFLLGGCFLLLVDLINRMISAAELPVSIISGILGLPLFIVCWFANARPRQEWRK